MIDWLRLSRSMPSRVKTWTSITVPLMPKARAASVLHVGGLLAEDGAQQLLFRGQLGLAFRRHLADQHVARLDFGADVHDSRLVEARELRLGQVGDVARDFFRPELVSRATTVSSSIWIEVKRSSPTTRSEIRIESSKL